MEGQGIISTNLWYARRESMDAQTSTLGGWLLLELNRRGMSQIDLAAALGVERPAVTKWINGRNRPDIESVVALADFFQVPITVILSKIGIEVDAARVRLPTNQAAGVAVPRVRRVSANPDDWWREAESVSTYVPTAPGTYGRRRCARWRRRAWRPRGGVIERRLARHADTRTPGEAPLVWPGSGHRSAPRTTGRENHAGDPDLCGEPL